MSMEQPWYADGLRFTCTQCGNCCTGAPGFVWVNADEIDALAQFLGTTPDEIRRHHTRKVHGRISLAEHENGDCVYFDAATRKCTVYSVRPRQCRTWPFWRSNLRTPEAWAEIQTTCPGAGHGELVPLQTIEERAAVIRI